MGQSVLGRFIRKYRELEELCYRVTVGLRDARGRFRRRRPTPEVSAALLKKIDLDRALVRLCDRFFGEEDIC